MKEIYLGFDIGTTNTKIISVDPGGNINTIENFKTRKYSKNDVEYIDLFFLKDRISEFIDKIKTEYRVLGISFSSIGESVVPVKNGRLLHDPILWYDICTEKVMLKYEKIIKENNDYSISGVRFNYIYSLYKIIWMKENLDIHDEDYWLPISSFFPYIFTGEAVWDYSQACRSYMFDIHERKWHKPILNAFDIPVEKLGKLDYTGSFIGRDNNELEYYLSGHDHITGLFAIKQLSKTGNFIYQSMGSSSVVAAVVEEKENELHFTEAFMKPKGTTGVAFKDRQYYIESSLRYFGKLLEWGTNLINCGDFDFLNREIEELKNKQIFQIAVNADPLYGDRISGINLIDLPVDFKREELIFNLYLYLVYMSRLITEKLQEYCDIDEFFCGGGCSKNNYLIRMLAEALNKPIKIFKESEITAIGAIMSAITGRGDENTKKELINKLNYTILQPNFGNTNKYLDKLDGFYKRRNF
jgi:sugar (pentulose or hexulose) kinase